MNNKERLEEAVRAVAESIKAQLTSKVSTLVLSNVASYGATYAGNDKTVIDMSVVLHRYELECLAEDLARNAVQGIVDLLLLPQDPPKFHIVAIDPTLINEKGQ